MSELVYMQSRNGKRYHVHDCPTLGPFPLSLGWANGKRGGDVEALMPADGPVPCKTCKPHLNEGCRR